MMNRRDLLLGLGCAGSVALAEGVRPRTRRPLLPDGTRLDDIVPGQFFRWKSGGAGSIVLPAVEGELASRLYEQQLARIYGSDDDSTPPIMLLIAYGGTQTDTLQLHRPETCYPAAGLQILRRSLVDLAITGSTSVPAVALTAASDRRIEDIVYWTRLGRSLPQTMGEQRMAVLTSSLRGYLEDGVLVRASAVRSNGKPLFGEISQFLSDLVAALQPAGRLALLGAGVEPLDRRERVEVLFEPGSFVQKVSLSPTQRETPIGLVR